MALRKACAYYRVSRGRKHRSKLNVHRQRAICSALAREFGFRIVEEFVEIEYSAGKETLDQRPELAKCLEFARSGDCTILASHIERVSRNVKFLTRLLQDGNDFIVGDVLSGEAAMTLGCYRAISKPLSNPPSPQISSSSDDRQGSVRSRRNFRQLREVGILGRQVSQEMSKKFAERIFPLIHELRLQGFSSLQEIADELNRQSIPTSRGKQWTPTAVRRVLLKSDPKMKKNSPTANAKSSVS